MALGQVTPRDWWRVLRMNFSWESRWECSGTDRLRTSVYNAPRKAQRRRCEAAWARAFAGGHGDLLVGTLVRFDACRFSFAGSASTRLRVEPFRRHVCRR